MWQFKTLTSNVFKRRTQFIDNFIFRCYYRGSFWILIIGCTLLSLRQYFGEHIHCMASKSLKNVINTFCFFSTTFTVVKHFKSRSVPRPGVGPVEDSDEVVYHAYYQWVPFFLFAQALLFYIPHMIWKRKERNRISKWTENSVPRHQIMLRLLVCRDWAKWMIICELLNAFNLILQVYLTDIFLGGRFFDLGYNYDDLETIFPKMTKCTWRQYGPSGTIQKHDALCLISLNMINEKIFIVLWYWYIFLAVFTICGLIWRLVMFLFHKRSCFNELIFSTFGFGAHLKSSQAAKIAISTDFTEWVLVYYLSKNLKYKDFLALVAGLGSYSDEFNKSNPDLVNPTDKTDTNLMEGQNLSPPETFKDNEESDC